MIRVARFIFGLLFCLSAFVQAEPYTDLQNDWAKANYELDGDQQKEYFEKLLTNTEQAKKMYPSDAGVYIWSGIINSTYAGVAGGLGALKYAKQARSDLERALEIDPDALQGSAYTSLGTLYYKVPGWPIGFGNDKKGEELLLKALTQNPDGIDPNYFYADFLYSKGRYQDALMHAEKAEQASPRLDRPLADMGRRQELTLLKEKIAAKIK